MAHKFNAENKKRLDSEKRREIMPPYDTLIKMGLKKGDVAADIGCGSGYFTIPAADILEGATKVYAMDISLDMLEEVEKKAKSMEITNIAAIKVDEYDLKVDDQKVSFSLACNVIHEIEDKDRFLREVARITSGKGTFAVIEWKIPRTSYGPPENERIQKEALSLLLEQNGFEPVSSEDIGDDFYCQLSVKR